MAKDTGINNPWTNPALSREIHKIPTWVALRWLIVLIFRGPIKADKYIRPQDRG